MTAVVAGERGVVDPVLLRLPAAAWRGLPALGVVGVVTLCAWVFGSWLLGPASPFLPLAIALLTAVPAAWAIGALQDRIFDIAPSPWRRRLLLTSLTGGMPAVALGWSLFTAEVAGMAANGLFSVLALTGAILGLILAVVGVVVLPVGAIRGEVGIRTLLPVCAVAAVRRPLGPLTALVAAGALAWLGLTWFGGLILLAAPLLILLSVAAAWPAVTASGVALPPLVPARRPTRGES